MEECELFRGYEQRKNIGKIMSERKYSTAACKDVEKKISCLSQRISDLEKQRRCSYTNSFKIKKKVLNQTNQIVKCFRERERNLLCYIDEAYMAQDLSIGEELSKLISTRACCQTLYVNIDDFRENLDVLSIINNYLHTTNFAGKAAFKPIEFISNFEQAKVDASNYGILKGEFVARNLPAQSEDENCSPAMLSKHTENQGERCKDCVLNSLQTTSEISQEMSIKIHKRERTDSQDSFEIVDMLENIHCEDNKDFIMSEKDCIPKPTTGSLSICKQEVTDSSEDSKEASNSAKYPKFEKQLAKLQQQLKCLSASTQKLSVEKVKNIPCPVSKIQNQKGETRRKILNVENESWLQKSTAKVDMMEIDKKVQNNSSAIKISGSPADLIKKAFTPYFVKENIQNWLTK